MIRFLVLWVVLLCAPAAWAQSSLGGGGGLNVPLVSQTAPTACPQGTSYANDNGVGDGCAGANQNAEFQLAQSPFLGRALGSGQTWAAPHPQAWNIAGRDYPIGYDKTLVLKDPSVSPPAGCAYSASILTCAAATNGPATIDIEGYDFSKPSGCTAIVIEPNDVNLATFTINNSKFVNGDSGNGQCDTLNGSLIKPNGGTNSNYTLIVTNSDLDGGASPASIDCSGAPCSVGDFRLISSGHHGSLILEYDVFQNSTGRPITWSGQISGGQTIARYNYTAGWVAALNSDHGEFIEQIAATNAVIPLVDYEYNICQMLVWQPVANTACFYPSTGVAGGQVFQSVIIDNNLISTNTTSGSLPASCNVIGGNNGFTLTITGAGACNSSVPIVVGSQITSSNLTTGAAQISAIVTPWNGVTGAYTGNQSGTIAPGTPINLQNRINSAALAEFSYITYGAVQLHNNWVDWTGSAFCLVTASNPTIGSVDFGSPGAGNANYSLLTGNQITGFNTTTGSTGCN